MPKPDKEVEKVSEKVSEKPEKETIIDPSTSSSDPRPELPFDITKIDPEKIKMAEEMGIPIGKMLQWIVHTEQRLNIIIKNMPNQKQIEKAMTDALINLRSQAPAVQSGAQGQPQGSSMVEKILLKALSGDSGPDTEMLALNKRFITVSIDNMQKRADASDKIVDAVVAKIVAKTVPKIID